MTRKQPDEPGWFWAANYGDTRDQFWMAVVRVDRDESTGRLFGSWLVAPGAAAFHWKEDWSPFCLWSKRIAEPDFQALLAKLPVG